VVRAWRGSVRGQYGRDGAQVIVTPRATGRQTVEKWLTGGRAAAIAAGAFGASSNRTADEHGGDFGGGGWIVGPDGDVLARTTRDDPFATAEIDLADADRARTTYPRYAMD
jgi:N-carbamoylputrescine amidase